MNNHTQFQAHFTLSKEAKTFFTLIGNNEPLQKRVYQTANLVEVSNMALEYNLQVSSHKILKAQAGRVLAIVNEKNRNDIQTLLDGGKPNSGAPWGRGSYGYLDNAGYWLVHLPHDTPQHNSALFLPLFQSISNNTLFEAELIQSQHFGRWLTVAADLIIQ